VKQLLVLAVALLAFPVGTGLSSAANLALKSQNEAMFQQLLLARGLSTDQVTLIRRIFERSPVMGQGNPAITVHPVSTAACQAKLTQQNIHYENPRFEKICGGKYLAPLYNPAKEQPEDAKICIDQFEFPDIPCTYPVTWVRADEAAQICWAEGERMPDAHEWEGACEGDLEPPDYPFNLAKGLSPSDGIARMRYAHNAADEPKRSWSYGPEFRTGVCSTASFKTAGCDGGSFALCGSNTYPTGTFPECHSPLAVYDINGNAAEHMNLPLNVSQMSSRGSHDLGYTELKGSWFIFDTYRAHDDWCRWRAPFWHGTRVMDDHSHANYHLGFRCVKNVK
jgi:hypothetical protein